VQRTQFSLILKAAADRLVWVPRVASMKHLWSIGLLRLSSIVTVNYLVAATVLNV
jgi:hypothetical protein